MEPKNIMVDPQDVIAALKLQRNAALDEAAMFRAALMLRDRENEAQKKAEAVKE